MYNFLSKSLPNFIIQGKTMDTKIGLSFLQVWEQHSDSRHKSLKSDIGNICGNVITNHDTTKYSFSNNQLRRPTLIV